MSGSLNVIALISGGKDSLYSLLHCVQNGHKIEALANLYPASPSPATADHGSQGAAESEDINSFMYQTVGHSLVPAYATALELPLYRRRISGSPIQTGRYYDSRDMESVLDETEDLVPLLREVLHHHPQANAVCSGAILSTYQRTRIESVALRLGLTPLAYLWQYPALPPSGARPESLTGLLDDMHAAGCDSRIIKIASGGMQESLLWANVAEPRTSNRLVSGMAPFFENHEFWLRGAVLGEGGEYETLAIDGPSPVWKGRIAIEENENIVMDQEGGVRWLKLGGSKVIKKRETARNDEKQDLVRVPDLLDPQFPNMSPRLDGKHNTKAPTTKPPTPSKSSLPTHPIPYKADDKEAAIKRAADSDALLSDPGPLFISTPHQDSPLTLASTNHLSFKSSSLTISNLVAPEYAGGAAHQTSRIITLLQKILQSTSRENNINPPLSASDIIFSTILLSSMSDFPLVNAEYAKLFEPGRPNPPARVTIACGPSLPSNVLIALSVILDLGSRAQRRALHVQSRSYWAPANIGPYSQAICVEIDAEDQDGEQGRAELVHVAGQIPLVPATMEVRGGSFVEQASLGLQHLWRVGQERGVDCWAWGVAFLPRGRGQDGVDQRVGIAAAVWRLAHRTSARGESHLHRPDWGQDGSEDDASALDAWDLKHNRSGFGRVVPTLGHHLHILPNESVLVHPPTRPWVPACIIAEVEELPRSAPIEWHSFGLGHLAKRPARQPNVFVAAQKHPWGTLEVCSFRAPDKPSLGGEERFRRRRRPAEDGDRHSDQAVDAEHHFVSMQVFKPDDQGNDDLPNPPSLAEILSQIRGTGDRPGTELEHDQHVVHGTAYISPAEGRTVLDLLGGQGSMPGITLIPCRRLWGCCEAVESAEGETGPGRLRLAMTLRVDTIACVEMR